MTPLERKVHDHYPELSGQLLGVVQVVAQLPLEQMRSAVERIRFAGVLTGTSGGRPVNPQRAANDTALIEATIRFRDEIRDIIATRAAGQ